MTSPEPEGRDPEASILGCDYVSLPVDHLDEAVSFYRDVPGLNLRFETPERWAEFAWPPCLSRSIRANGTNTVAGTTGGWQPDRGHARLEASGVESRVPPWNRGIPGPHTPGAIRTPPRSIRQQARAGRKPLMDARFRFQLIAWAYANVFIGAIFRHEEGSKRGRGWRPRPRRRAER